MLKTLFLDRDGIINEDKGYIYKSVDVEFVPGIFEMLRAAKENGYTFVVITNQSGIARGMYSEEDVKELHSWMKNRFAQEGVDILDFIHCPHHPKHSGDCSCRKPEPGMIMEAVEKHSIDPAKSIIIGDKKSDVMAGVNAGLWKTILVKSVYSPEDIPEADFFAEDLFQAADYIRECS